MMFRMLVWKPYSRMIDALAFSPCGRALALAGYGLACRTIDSFTGERLWSVYSNTSFGLSLTYTADGDVLCRPRGVSLRAGSDGSERRAFARWCQSFALTPCGRATFVADGGYQDVLRRYPAEGDEPVAEVQLESGAINRLAVSPNGEWLAAVGCKRFFLLRADTLGVVASSAHRALSSGAFALAFAPDGETVAYTAGRALFVWNVARQSQTHHRELGTKHFMDAAFAPNGRSLFTVSKEGAVRVWDAETFDCARSYEWEIGPLRAVAVSPDGARAAAAGSSGRVVVWDLDA
jgi:WD40 repeat protein